MASYFSKYTGTEIDRAVEVTQNLATVATSGRYGDLSGKPIYYNTSAYGATQTTFIGNAGDIIIYSDYKVVDNKKICGLKVSDGTSYIVDAPFVGEGVEEELDNHIRNTTVHITAAERNKWNNKVAIDESVVNETLNFLKG